MNLRDMLYISVGNLRRMKLRTFLTASGVVIAIAAFVSMLSFGAGMQENVAQEFNNLGLFNTMIVYEKDNDTDIPGRHREQIEENTDEKSDSLTVDSSLLIDSVVSEINKTDTTTKKLNSVALKQLAEIPGVSLAYPYESFTISVKIDDSTYNTEGQALPLSAYQTKLYSNITHGAHLTSDSLKEVLLTEEFIKEYKFENPDSLIGKRIIVSAKAVSVDSGLYAIINSDNFNLKERIKSIKRDSLFNKEYITTILKTEANDALQRFLNGYMKNNEIVDDTLTVVGILDNETGRRTSAKPILIPMYLAEKFNSKRAGQGAMDFVSMISQGKLDIFKTQSDSKYYSKITLNIEQGVLHKAVADSVRALGYRPFSYAQEFEEIQKFFFYFDMGLGLIGLIALITASLGIVNTMVMSIIERKREIGVLKSLGADELYIKLLFLTESAMIGTIGASAGILFGWLISRLGSFIAQSYMEKEGVDTIELFSMPIWLVLIAFAIGLVVSLLAGYFPASKAAKVDPVEALRND